MSAESPSRDLSADQPWSQLIAEARAKLGLSDGALAAEITEAAYELDGKTSTVHASSIWRWERGGVGQKDLRRWTARVLQKHGLPITEAELHAAAKSQKRARRGQIVAQQKPAEQPLDVQATAASSDVPHEAVAAVESSDMERRLFNKFIAMAGIGAATGIDFDRYAAVLAGTRADAAALDDFETITLDFIRREPTVSPQSLLPGVRGHLVGLRDVLISTPLALAPRAYSLAGQTALLAGYLWYQQHDYAQADVYWSLAERWGEIAGDVRLRAALLELQASRWHAPGDIENLPRALLLLDQAVAVLGAKPDPAIAAYILSFRARYRAEASRVAPGSDHDHQALRDIDRMRSHLSRMTSTDTRVYIVGSVSGETTQGHARALVHMNQAGDAVTYLERLLDSVEDGSLSWRAGIIADLAAAHAAMGEHEYAADLLADALSLAQQAGAGRNLQRVRQTRQRWLSDHDGPALRRLDEQLRALPASAGGALPASSG